MGCQGSHPGLLHARLESDLRGPESGQNHPASHFSVTGNGVFGEHTGTGTGRNKMGY